MLPVRDDGRSGWIFLPSTSLTLHENWTSVAESVISQLFVRRVGRLSGGLRSGATQAPRLQFTRVPTRIQGMTCIVAVRVETDGAARIVMGGDSAGVAGHDILIRKDPKVFRNDELLVGFTSSFRMGQIMRFKFAPPAIPPGMDLYEYMVVHFVDRVRSVLKEGGFAEVQNSVERGGSFIVGLRERIFTIGSDFQVGENVDGFASVGSGADYALGALEILHTLPSLTGEEIVEMALRAAAKFSGGVRAPFVVMSSQAVPERQLLEVTLSTPELSAPLEDPVLLLAPVATAPSSETPV